MILPNWSTPGVKRRYWRGRRLHGTSVGLLLFLYLRSIPLDSPQCQAPNSELPADCAVCGLKLVLAPHLARSFHHLFPVPTFTERAGQPPPTNPPVASSMGASRTVQTTLNAALLLDSSDSDTCCYACVRPLVTKEGDLLRLECPECKNVFCVDCDAYIHHSLHNCPGCLSK